MDLYLMSVKSGLFCRTLDANATASNTTVSNTTSTNTTETESTATDLPTILCDMVDLANATAMNYLGNSLTVDNATIISNATLFISPSEPRRPLASHPLHSAAPCQGPAAAPQQCPASTLGSRPPACLSPQPTPSRWARPASSAAWPTT
jgi:hypothetical protein